MSKASGDCKIEDDLAWKETPVAKTHIKKAHRLSSLSNLQASQKYYGRAICGEWKGPSDEEIDMKFLLHAFGQKHTLPLILVTFHHQQKELYISPTTLNLPRTYILYSSPTHCDNSH